jgi:hypothetical protein
MSMMLPTIKLLGIGAAPVSPSGSATPRMEAFIREQLIVPDYHPAVRDAGQWLITNLPHDEFQVFVLIMVTIAVLSIIGSTGRYIHELFTLTVIYRAMMRWREQMLRRVIAAPMIELLRTGTSDVISRINSDAQVLSNGYRAQRGGGDHRRVRDQLETQCRRHHRRAGDRHPAAQVRQAHPPRHATSLVGAGSDARCAQGVAGQHQRRQGA